MVEETMRRIVTDIAAAKGCTAELEYSYLEPSVVNGDPELTKIAREAAEKLYGPGAWAEAKKASGSEDFSYVMDHICFLFFCKFLYSHRSSPPFFSR